MSGTARVHRDGQIVTALPAGFFVGEMSLLTGRPATADVDIDGPSDIVRWPRPDLEALRQRDPMLWTRIQSVLGLDLVIKVRRAETDVAPQ